MRRVRARRYHSLEGGGASSKEETDDIFAPLSVGCVGDRRPAASLPTTVPAQARAHGSGQDYRSLSGLPAPCGDAGGGKGHAPVRKPAHERDGKTEVCLLPLRDKARVRNAK